MTTLVMFSGGIDSTAMLVKLLTQDADELRVHHVHLVNREGRDRANDVARQGREMLNRQRENITSAFDRIREQQRAASDSVRMEEQDA